MTQADDPSNQPAEKFGHAPNFLFLAFVVANGLSFVFHTLAGRRLGPVDYGTFAGLLAFLNVLIIPGNTLQTLAARGVVVLKHAQTVRFVPHFILRMSGWVGILGAVILLGLALTQNVWRDFFHLGQSSMLFATGLCACLMLWLSVFRGLLQGLQRFRYLGISIIFDSVMRVTGGLLFFMWGWQVTGGLLAVAMGSLGSIALSWWAARELLRPTGAQDAYEGFQQVYRDSLPTLLMFGAYAVLSNVDMILIKNFFPPEMVGQYSVANLLGKSLIILPFAISQVLFPKASLASAQESSSVQLLYKSLVWAGGGLLAAIGVIWIFSRLIVTLLFGAQYLLPETLFLMRMLSLAIFPLAMVFVVLQYHLALRRWVLGFWLWADAAIMIAALWFWHRNIYQVLWVIGLNHAVLFFITLGYTRRVADAAPNR